MWNRVWSGKQEARFCAIDIGDPLATHSSDVAEYLNQIKQALQSENGELIIFLLWMLLICFLDCHTLGEPLREVWDIVDTLEGDDSAEGNDQQGVGNAVNWRVFDPKADQRKANALQLILEKLSSRYSVEDIRSMAEGLSEEGNWQYPRDVFGVALEEISEDLWRLN